MGIFPDILEHPIFSSIQGTVRFSIYRAHIIFVIYRNTNTVSLGADIRQHGHFIYDLLAFEIKCVHFYSCIFTNLNFLNLLAKT